MLKSMMNAIAVYAFYAFYAFFLVVLVVGLVAFLMPARFVAFRRSQNWSEGFLSGGILFATEIRTRWTGAMLVVVAVVVLLSWIAGADKY